jgi:hypothetical protein
MDPKISSFSPDLLLNCNKFPGGVVCKDFSASSLLKFGMTN